MVVSPVPRRTGLIIGSSRAWNDMEGHNEFKTVFDYRSNRPKNRHIAS
jgi:hypothetical protein